MVLAAGVAPALATLSTSCLCWLDYASKGNWSLQPGMLRQEFLTKEIRRRCVEAKVEFDADYR